ncbi:hypothetical protein [Actinomycetospora callitridis]|uniref:hypothetical protein n=1 Tax=Actinomycetospora callitridis TaxID=913944 RepID=UPI00236617F1|nr:hypothetical protein [Actinomycetospora callitridis]MDD7919267.1 hypothetical protein [Actinomycetospora callitridis]
MDHATIRSSRRWLLAATVPIAGIGSRWADAADVTDAPSSPRMWVDVALAVAALVGVAVVGGLLRRQRTSGSDSTGVERRTTA